MHKNPNGTVTVRVRATGQVIDMVPDAAAAMLSGGTVEEVHRAKPETMSVASAGERAVAPAQSPAQKSRAGKSGR